MKSFLAAFLLTLASIASLPAQATAQEPDSILIDGERLALYTNVLAPMIESGAITIPKSDQLTSANWRGYVATFQVRGNELVLTGISIMRTPRRADFGVLRIPKDAKDDNEDPVPTEVLPEVFPGKTEVPATWYTGALILPRGELVAYVHMGYGSTYARYTVLTVKRGKLVDRKDLDAEQYTALRKLRFEQFKKTPAYAEHIRSMRAQKEADGFSNDEFLYEFATAEYMALSDPR